MAANDVMSPPAGFRAAWLGPVAVPMLAFLVTVAVFLPFSMRGIDPHHDGVVFKSAVDVASGQTVHKDSFTQYGALTVYLQAGMVGLAGKYLLALKIGTVLCYGVTAAFLVAAWRMLLPLPLVIVSTLLWLGMPSFYSVGPRDVFLSWSSVDALMFQSMSLYFLLRSVKSPAIINPLLCGMLGALVAWCRLPTGGVHAAAVAVFFAIMIYATPQRRRFLGALAAYLGGTALVHAAFFAHLWWIGALRDWYCQILVWPSQFAVNLGPNLATPSAIASKVFRSLFLLEQMVTGVAEWYAPGIPRKSQGRMGLVFFVLIALFLAGLLAIPQLRRSASPCGNSRGRFSFLATFLPLALFAVISRKFLYDTVYHPDITYCFAIPVVILAATLATLVRGFLRPGRWEEPDSPAVLALACGLVCLASWLQYHPISDSRHRFWAAAPGIGLFAFFMLRSAGGRPLAVAAALAAFALPLWSVQVNRVIEARRYHPYVRIDGHSPLAGMYVPSDDAPKWKNVLDAIDRQLAVRPDVPMLSIGPDALYGTLVRNLRNPYPFYVLWKKSRFDWALFGVPDLDAKQQAFIDTYHPLIYYHPENAGPRELFEAQGYRVIADEKGLCPFYSPNEVVLMADEPAATTTPRRSGGLAVPGGVDAGSR